MVLSINILAISSLIYADDGTNNLGSEDTPPPPETTTLSVDVTEEEATTEVVPVVPKTYITSIVELNKGVKISWKKRMDVTGYKIYRSVKPNNGFKRIKTIKKSTTGTFKDLKAKAGTVYYYKIKCYKDKLLSDSSNAVVFETSDSDLKLDFHKNLGKFVKKYVHKKYPCNVLVNKYVESCKTLAPGKKATRSGQFTSVKVNKSPVANDWKSGNVKITYKVSRKKCTYYLKGNIRKTTYPLFKTSLKLNDVDTESNMEHLIPGDIIAYTSSSGRAHHVAIYIGKFDTKQDLVNYLNSDAVGLNCTGNESWIKSWNGSCKHWVIQGGMGNNNDVYICNNANVTTTNRFSSHFCSLRKRLTLFSPLQ